MWAAPQSSPGSRRAPRTPSYLASMGERRQPAGDDAPTPQRETAQRDRFHRERHTANREKEPVHERLFQAAKHSPRLGVSRSPRSSSSPLSARRSPSRGRTLPHAVPRHSNDRHSVDSQSGDKQTGVQQRPRESPLQSRASLSLSLSARARACCSRTAFALSTARVPLDRRAPNTTHRPGAAANRWADRSSTLVSTGAQQRLGSATDASDARASAIPAEEQPVSPRRCWAL